MGRWRSDRAGTGVQLDREQLGTLHELYLSCDVRGREDTAYMPSVDPDSHPTPRAGDTAFSA